MTTGQTELHAAAAAAQLQPRTLRAVTGSILLTVHGARVLGAFLDGIADNLLWTNAALAGPDQAREFVMSGGWNLGGDRCWLAPELELHFLDPDHPTHDNYAVPPGIDPGQYTIEHEGESGIALASNGRAHNLVSERPFTFLVRHVIQLCPPPLDPGPLSYVGYEISAALRVTSADRPEAEYGLWHLLQVPAGGAAHVPVRRAAELVDYFQTDVARHCTADEHGVRFPITGRQKQKLGLRGADVWGLIGYYRPLAGGLATLIVRQAAVFAGAVYADYPAHARGRRDIALQFYNDDPTPAGEPSFGELEYHTPAARRENFFHVRDVSRTWCFGGPAEQVRSVAQYLLGRAAG
ncbi:MAG: DUF6786 family protein [Planctomycetota bacterium]